MILDDTTVAFFRCSSSSYIYIYLHVMIFATTTLLSQIRVSGGPSVWAKELLSQGFQPQFFCDVRSVDSEITWVLKFDNVQIWQWFKTWGTDTSHINLTGFWSLILLWLLLEWENMRKHWFKSWWTMGVVMEFRNLTCHFIIFHSLS